MGPLAPVSTATRSCFGLARRRLVVAAMLGMLAVQWAHAVCGFGGAPGDDFFSRWMYDAIGIASGAILVGHGLDAPRRKPWLVLGLGLVLKGAGDLVYSLSGDLAAVPVPSLSDPLWLAFYPCAYAALVLLGRDRIHGILAATRLDGLICGITAASALACVTLPTAFSNSAGDPFWTKATELAYPIGDLVLMGTLVSLGGLSGWRIDRTLGVLAAAIVGWEAADLMYLFSVSGTAGNIADALVLTGAGGMAVAAIIDRPTRGQATAHERGLFVPVAFGAAALTILIGGAALGLQIVGLALATAALSLLLVRMALALSENRALLQESRVQATTDPLTQLGNRRKLKRDLAHVLADIAESHPFALVILDLNGFKNYNDSFGHAAGDMLLARLGGALAAVVRERGEAYRLGGDEFCVLAPCPAHHADRLSSTCAQALASRGEGFSITAAHGVVLLPVEAREASNALALADARMYANKASAARPRAAGDLTRVLTAVLEERAPALAERSKDVCSLALATAVHLGLSDEKLEALRHAATLHDIGKMAIPDSILDKPGPLSAAEWRLVHQHPIIGERILAAAPALHRAGRLIRSSHERWDGDGYPDRLHRDEIPLPSRIIAVADAFNAMTTPRAYKPILSTEAAIAELRRCAASQFDPRTVAAFEHALANAQLSSA